MASKAKGSKNSKRAARTGLYLAQRPKTAKAKAAMSKAVTGEPMPVKYRGKKLTIVATSTWERLVEQEEDRQDVEISERRLSDPTQVPIPFADVCRELGLPEV